MEVVETENPALFDRIVPVIPEMHVKCHDVSCQYMLHPKRVPGTGMTDGEGTERLWSWLHKLHHLVKEQSAENRREQLCDSLQHLTRKKLLAIGTELNRKHNYATEGLQTSLMILKHEMGDKYTIQDIRNLYAAEKLGQMRPVQNEKLTPSTLRLPVPLQEQYTHIRCLERSRYQVRRWRDSHKLPGGTKNTLGFSNSISIMTKSIKDAVYKANEMMIGFEEAGQDCGEPLTVQITSNFKSWFWKGYKVEEGGVRVVIEAYCLVIHHLEELNLLQVEIKRSLSHIENDIQLLCAAMNEMKGNVSVGLLAHLHKEIYELKRCYSKHVVHETASHDSILSDDLGMSIAVNCPDSPTPVSRVKIKQEPQEARYQQLVPQLLTNLADAVPEINVISDDDDVDDQDDDALQVLDSRDVENTINVVYDEIDMRRWLYILTSPTEWLSNFLLHKAFLCLHENSPNSHLFETPGLSLEYGGSQKDAIQFDHVSN